MQWRDNPERYGAVSKLFHWGMAVLVIYMLYLGLTMEDLPLGPEKLRLIGLHKSLGIIVLVLALLRLKWRWFSKTPPLPDDLDKMHRVGSKLAHSMFYGLLILIPLCGWVMSSARGFSVSVFGWGPLPDFVNRNEELGKISGEAHEILAFALIGVIVLHVLAALVHHFKYKNRVLKRMLPWVK